MPNSIRRISPTGTFSLPYRVVISTLAWVGIMRTVLPSAKRTSAVSAPSPDFFFGVGDGSCAAATRTMPATNNAGTISWGRRATVGPPEMTTAASVPLRRGAVVAKVTVMLRGNHEASGCGESKDLGRRRANPTGPIMQDDARRSASLAAGATRARSWPGRSHRTSRRSSALSWQGRCTAAGPSPCPPGPGWSSVLAATALDLSPCACLPPPRSRLRRQIRRVYRP